MGNLTKQIAKHFHEVHFGKNWTWSNLKDNLEDVTWEQATTKLPNYNTIAALVFHINYYVRAITRVLEGNPIDAHDKYSFDVQPINSAEEWQEMLENVWADAEKYVKLVEELPDEQLSETFVAEKYGNYYRNLHGVIEHTHYHLGQIVIIKKMLTQQ